MSIPPISSTSSTYMSQPAPQSWIDLFNQTKETLISNIQQANQHGWLNDWVPQSACSQLIASLPNLPPHPTEQDVIDAARDLNESGGQFNKYVDPVLVPSWMNIDYTAPTNSWWPRPRPT